MSKHDKADNVRPLERARDAVSEVVDRGRETARERLNEARERFQEVTEKARDRASHVRGAARERYDDTVVQLRDGYSQVRDNVEGWSEELQDYVREHPGRSVLFAALIGFVIGLLFRRRNDD